MIRSFLSLVSVALLPVVASAQLPASPYAVPQSCPGGVCPRVQAAVQTVRSAGADVIHAAGNVVHFAGNVVGGPQPAVTYSQVHPAPMTASACGATATPHRFPRLARLFGR